MSDDEPCKRACCWTPFGTCGRGRQCPCHTGPGHAWEATAAAIRAENYALSITTTNQDNPDGGSQ